MNSPGAWMLLGVMTLLAPTAARAEDSASREAALFDRPVAVKDVEAKPGKESRGDIRCTYYGDIMVRETGTDSPAPEPAVIVPVAGAARRPACTGVPAAREMALKTEEFALLGRKGPYLVFDAADPHGAVEFSVLDAGSGRILFSDGKNSDGLRSVSLDGGALRLRYTRAVNASCSIVKDGAGCWSKVAQEAGFPPALGQSPPPVEACAAAYRKGKVPADDPSMVTYAVDVRLDTSGKVEVSARGAPGCEPLP